VVGDLHKWYFNTAIALSDGTKFDEGEWRRISHVLYLSNVRLHLSVSVGNSISHVYFILVVVEPEVETHSIVRFGLVRVHLVDFDVVGRDIVVHVESTLEPASARVRVVLQRPERGLHSIVKQGVALCKVYDVDADHVSEVLGVPHSEEEPLEVTVPVGVVSNPQVVLYVRPLSHLVDVATLELGIESNLVRLYVT